MQKIEIFNILGIEETKDINTIKTAYRQKLTSVNPEDDAEGFKKLREAYEEALQYANTEEEKEEVIDTPVSRWMNRVENVYNKLSTRIDISCWKELLQDDICLDLDSADEAKKAFLVFLMDHFRLPVNVWELILNTFQIRETKEELYEIFPVDFIDYISEDLENKTWLDYQLFSGNEEADIDNYIDLIVTARKLNNSEEYEDMENVLNQLEQMDLSHPLADVEIMRYYQSSGKIEEALEIATALRSKKYEDLFIKYYIAFLYSKTNHLEEAFKECNEILEIDTNYYGAVILVGAYYLEKEEYQKAKDTYLSMIDQYPQDEALNVGIQKANLAIIEEYKGKIDQEPDNISLKIDLGKCYYQNDLFDECISLLQNIDIDEENAFSYYQLLSRSYMGLDQYEKAFPNLKLWLAELQKRKDDETEPTQNSSLAYAHYLLSLCYMDQHKDDKTLESIDLAIELSDDKNLRLEYLSKKAYMLFHFKEYERCIDVCDEIITIEENYYGAYLLRMETCYQLGMNQEVIDDAFKAVNLYPQGAKPYILAIKVYLDYDMMEDATNVLNRGKENGVQSNEFIFQELRMMRKTAKSSEQVKIVIEKLDDLYKKVQEESDDFEDSSLLFHEKAACYYDIGEYNEALESINEALKLNKNNDSITLKGSILYCLDEYEEALDIFSEIIKSYPQYVYGHYIMGRCYQYLDKRDDAIACYVKALEIDSEHRDANYQLLRTYTDFYTDNYEKKYFDLAVKYGKRQLEINPSQHVYGSLGYAYYEGYELEEALTYYQESITLDETYAYGHRMIGYINTILKNYEKAYHSYELAIEHSDDSDLDAHWNLASYYRKTKQYDKAIETYEMLAQKCRSKKDAYYPIATIYNEQKEWDKAIKVYEKIAEISDESELKHLTNVGYVHLYSKNKEEALKIVRLLRKDYPDEKDTFTFVADYLFHLTSSHKKALRYYKKANSIAKKDEENYDDNVKKLLEDIIFILKSLNKEEESIPYFEALNSYLQRTYGGESEYLNDPTVRKARYYDLAFWNYHAGNFEKTREFMDQMKNCTDCYHCKYSFCIEYCMLEGMMLEAEGRYEEALEKYQKAMDVWPDNLELSQMYYRTKEKLGETQL